MSRGKTRFGRGRYNADYAPDSSGKYVYIGSHYRPELPPDKVRRTRALLAVQTALGAIAFVAGGLSNGQTSRTLYALLPFVCCMLPLFYFGMGLGKWMTTREDLTLKGMDESFHRMKHSAVGLMICAGLALAGGIVACIVQRTVAREVVFLISSAVLLALGIILNAQVRAIPIREIRRSDQEEN